MNCHISVRELLLNMHGHVGKGVNFIQRYEFHVHENLSKFADFMAHLWQTIAFYGRLHSQLKCCEVL